MLYDEIHKNFMYILITVFLQHDFSPMINIQVDGLCLKDCYTKFGEPCPTSLWYILVAKNR